MCSPSRSRWGCEDLTRASNWELPGLINKCYLTCKLLRLTMQHVRSEDNVCRCGAQLAISYQDERRVYGRLVAKPRAVGSDARDRE